MVEAFTAGRIGLKHSDIRSDVRRVERWIQSWVYICIERNAVAVTQQNCRMYTRNPAGPRATKDLTYKDHNHLKSAYGAELTEDTKEAPDHPFLRLLDRPNPILDRSGLFWLTVAYLQSTGRALWHMKFDDDGMPIEIWPLPSQYTVPVFGPDSVIDHYELRYSSHVQTFSREEIAHFRCPSPIDTISDFGNLRGILETAETDVRMMEYERAVFDNMAVPDILISAKGDTTTHQIEALQANWEHEFKGHRRRGKTAAVPFPIDVTQLSFKNRDLEFDKGSIRVRDKVAAGFGVPIPILTSTSATFNNMDIGVQLWMRNKISPLLLLIASTINHDIMPRYAPREEDLDSGVPERPPWFIAWDNPVPEDLTSQGERDVADIGAGVSTINEVRRERNKEPVAWGNEPWLNSALVTPAMALENQRFDQEMARMAFDRQAAAEDAAAESGTPVTFTELTTALDLAARIGDIGGVNLIRERIAGQLDGELTPITELAPDTRGAVVEPEDAAEKPKTEENTDEQANGLQEQGDGGEGSEVGEGSDGSSGEEGTGGGGKSSRAKDGVRGNERPDAGDGAGREDAGESEGRKGADAGGNKDGDSGDGATHDKDVRKDVPARSRWLDTIAGAYAKINQERLEPENRDKTLEVVLAALFAEFEADVIEHLAIVAEKRLKASDTISGQKLLKSLFSRDAWIKRFKDAAIATLGAAFLRGAALAVRDLAVSSTTVDQMAPDVAEKHIERLAESFASVVVDITGEQLVAALLPGMREGENIQELSGRVAKVYGKRKDNDAERIARTEVNTALNAGASETFAESGIKRQEWSAPSDACEFCTTLDGKVVAIGQPFAALGSTVKGSQGGSYKVKYRPILYPTLHPNCTCTIVPVVE